MVTVVREAQFPGAPVRDLLSFAEAAEVTVSLVKDDGAYLMADVDHPMPDYVVYAAGHHPPPRDEADPRSGGADDPWIVARAATREVWGDDDFAETYTPAQLRQVLGPAGIRVVIELDRRDLPAEYPASPWGRRDPLCRRHAITLSPARGRCRGGPPDPVAGAAEAALSEG